MCSAKRLCFRQWKVDCSVVYIACARSFEFDVMAGNLVYASGREALVIGGEDPEEQHSRCYSAPSSMEEGEQCMLLIGLWGSEDGEHCNVMSMSAFAS